MLQNAPMHRVDRLFRVFFAFALAVQGGCWSANASYPSSGSGSVLYTQYVVNDAADTASVDCFYACLRRPAPGDRQACLSQCDGVMRDVTTDPCSPVITHPCSYDALVRSEPLPPDDSADESLAEGDDSGGGLIGAVVEAVTDVAVSHDREGPDSARGSRRPAEQLPHAGPATNPPHPNPPVERRIAEPTPGGERRRYRVAHPEPANKE